jgi:hypothetical protein
MGGAFCKISERKAEALEGSRFRLLRLPISNAKVAHSGAQGCLGAHSGAKECPFRCQGVPIQVPVGASSTPNETTFTSFPGGKAANCGSCPNIDSVTDLSSCS